MNPDDLLAQIRDLLDQYLALGGDTPVAPEAQALASAIDSAGIGAPAAASDVGGNPPPTGPVGPGAPPDLGAAPPGGVPPDQGPIDTTALAPGEQGYSGGSFDEARAGAKDLLSKRDKKKAKA